MQAPHQRLEGHVPYAQNAIFSVMDNGFSCRPPTTCTIALGTALVASSNYRLHILAYGGSEIYDVIYGTTSGAGVVRIIEPNGLDGLREAYVSVSANAQTYLDTSATALDRLRMAGSVDKAYIVNTEATPACVETTGSINAATVANPTELTTTANHGLSTGDYVTIASSAGTTPNIDGSYQITVTAVNKFTIPVNVTAAAGVTATWYNAKWTATTMPVKISKTKSASGPYTITAISVEATPETIITIGSHTLLVGQKVLISGSDSTPTVDGVQTITAVTGTTITVAVDVTIAGTTGTAYANASFAVDVETWKQRQSGTPTTNPVPTFITNAKKIRDVAVYEGRLAVGAGPYAQFSQTNDLTDFFLADPSNVVESDPFGLTLGEGLADIDYFTTPRRALLAFGRNGVQYDIGTRGDAFTQAKATVVILTRYRTDGARPAVSDNLVYFGCENDRVGEMRELTYDEVYKPTDAPVVSAHVPDLIFLAKPEDGNRARVKTIVSAPQSGTVLMFRTQFSTSSYRGSDVFRYNTYFGPNRDVLQRAWTRLTYADAANNENLMDVAAYGNDFHAIRGHTLGGSTYWYLEISPISPTSSHQVTDAAPTTVLYPAMLDCQETATGTASAIAITGISIHATAPTITAAAHGLQTGDRATLSGTNSTPTIDGTYTVTRTGANTFTVATTTTGTGNAGTATYTAWTFASARPFTYALYKPTGEALTLGTETSGAYTRFTAGGDYAGGAAVLGLGYLMDVVLPECVAKSEDRELEMADVPIVRYAVLHCKDTIKFDVYRQSKHPTIDTRSGTDTFTNTSGVGSFGLNEHFPVTVLVLADASDLLLRVRKPVNYPYPVTIVGVQYECSLSTQPRFSRSIT